MVLDQFLAGFTAGMIVTLVIAAIVGYVEIKNLVNELIPN